MDLESKIILIYGPTASGKSKFALKLAQKIDGEIINADSMQVYKELKVLSARPRKEDINKIKHHLYGFQSVKKNFSTGDWLKLAQKKIFEVKKKGKIPILVGGTGLYFKALTEGLVNFPKIPVQFRKKIRALHKNLGAKKFFLQLIKEDPLVRNHLIQSDTQRVIRAYEIKKFTNKSMYEWFKNTKSEFEKNDFFKIYIDFPRTDLLVRIKERAVDMLDNGAVSEVKKFMKLKVPKVKSANNVIDKISIKTRQYAKRQTTWARGNMSDWNKIKSSGLKVFLKKI